MNKDREQELPVEARIHLFTSDKIIKRDMLKCQQLYFDTEVDCEEIDNSLRVMLNCLRCVSCDRIPLELQECACCMAIICKQCEATIHEKDDPTERRCPDPDCDDADEGTFRCQEFTSKMMI